MQEQDNGKRCIIVIGDIMLDEYVFGTVNRVSPESCCPVLLSQRISYQLGGAANVAYQITKLGRKVFLAGIVGKDDSANEVFDELAANNIDDRLLFKHDNVTTTKIRYVNDVHQQMFRVDKEEYSCLTQEELNVILSFLKENKENIDCIILSDYNKGVLTCDSCQAIIDAANQLEIASVVDIKIPDIKKYQNATVIKGNLKEFAAFFPLAENVEESIETSIRMLKKNLKSKFFAVTLGKKGISGIDSQEHYIHHKANQVMVYDVTGAGDIVTAYIGTNLNRYPFSEVLNLANKAAGIKVTRFGNSYVPFSEVSPSDNKIIKASDIPTLTKGKTIVFTNGCFDVFHAGHADLLHYAKSKGDVLVVGINTDESIRKIKGEKRPVNTLEMRTKVLSSMIDVDYIVCFDDTTPDKIIREIHPDVLIKGGDYAIDNIVGADFVQSYGGIVETMPFHYNQSSTKILSCL